MLEAAGTARLAEVCVRISNEVADGHGFVPIRSLLSRIGADLLVRPLLVEGMLATVPLDSQAANPRRKWLVLVDSDTYSVTESDLATESWEQALPSRFRNTVAHELAHSLALGSPDLAEDYQSKLRSMRDRTRVLHAIEGDTERLSPLLLWSEKAITTFLGKRERAITVEELHSECRSMGISRHVLVSRLRELQRGNTFDLLSSQGLRNVAIGVGEWQSEYMAVTRSRLLFANFDRNIYPEFVHAIAIKDRAFAADIFPSESFAARGGRDNVVEFETHAGTASAPQWVRMRVTVAMEQTTRKAGAEFLYLITGKDRPKIR